MDDDDSLPGDEWKTTGKARRDPEPDRREILKIRLDRFLDALIMFRESRGENENAMTLVEVTGQAVIEMADAKTRLSVASVIDRLKASARKPTQQINGS